MAHHKSAKKRIVLSKIQNQRNQAIKSTYKTAVKRVLDSDSKETATEALRNAESVIDKAKNRNIVHKNRAARKKAQLAEFVNNIA